jgi:hypothetical protein
MKWFMPKKKNVTFVLSSGKEIKFAADEITGGTGKVFYCKLEDISAITIDE